MRLHFGLLCSLAVALVGCRHAANNLPPAPMVMSPGPGVGGPGPGVIAPVCAGIPGRLPTSQIAFMGPEGMSVQWDVSMPGAFDSAPLVSPGRYNFPQGAIYRLKLTNVPGRPGIELYPTLEVGPSMPRTEAFLAHNAIPVQFTEEDFDQVLSGNFVTKVIYLPDPQFQQLALAGVETLVSTRLDPGVDPIVEADRRGAIMAVVRLGNKDLEIPGQPAQMGGVTPASYQVPMGSPCPPQAGAAMPLGMPSGACPIPGAYVAGVSAPQYGMPMCGTPIGLPGPPHIPLGVPAGLQCHTVTNHTRVHIPPPTESVKIDVKQRPGLSYPEPANHVRIVENTHPGGAWFHGRHSAEVGAAPCPQGPFPVPDTPGAPCPAPAAAGGDPCPAPAAQSN